MERCGSLPERLADGPAASVCLSDGNGSGWSREALAMRVEHVAAQLADAGLCTVALHLDNQPDWIVADLACQAAGICLVPLPTFFAPGQLRHVLESLPIDAVIGSDRSAGEPLYAERLRTGPEIRIGNARLVHLEPAREPLGLPPGTGKVTFTSGSTGQPKGVCLSNEQLGLQAEALARAVALEQPRHLCLMPLSTLLENVAGVYAPLLSGGEVIVPPLAEVGLNGSSSLDSRRMLHAIGRHRPNSLILTPQLLQVLVAAARAGWTPPDSLRFVAVGGARVPNGLVESAHALGLPAYEGYGLSECASVVSLNTPVAARPGSCGRPLPHLRVELIDGEIHVGGNAMLGYAGDPGSWGQETIATGDLGSLDAEGFLHIEGRRKNLLISSYGRNISPEWVESELLADGSLADCVVFGDARPWCVALVSPRSESQSDEAIEASIRRCNEALPDYARIRGWQRLPETLGHSSGLTTDNGRPRRAAIHSRYAALIDALYRDVPHEGITDARIA